MKKKWGGNRPNAGAKKKSPAEKKQQIQFGIKGSDIEILGGKEEIKIKVNEFINQLLEIKFAESK